MKPIFSTEQARYQKFASFFFDVTGVSRVCVKVCATRKLSAGISLSAESDKGCEPLTSPPFEKGGRKLSRLGSAVGVRSDVTLGSAVGVRSDVTLGSA